MAKKTKAKQEELGLTIGKEGSTVFIDKSGTKIEAVRCGQCKGNGCDGCDNLGFLKQGTLL